MLKMKMKREMVYNIFLFIAAIVPIILFNRANEYHRIERYYYNNHRWGYIAIQITYYTLVLAAVVNARFFVFDLVLGMYKQITSKSKARNAK